MLEGSDGSSDGYYYAVPWTVNRYTGISLACGGVSSLAVIHYSRSETVESGKSLRLGHGKGANAVAAPMVAKWPVAGI